MKVLLAADGSKFTKRMLAFVVAHDEWLGHSFTVLTVQAPLPARAAAALSKKVVQQHYEREAEQVFKPIRAFLSKRGIEAEFVQKVGEPGEEIAALARKGGFDLVVMGSHGFGALARLVLGSVTSRVLASCEVPLLIVR
jgi:nucleotide-binding universal stress UspA family protein